MESEEFAKLRKTHIRVEVLGRHYANPGALEDAELIGLAFDAANNLTISVHERGIEELGKRLVEGKLDGCAAEALFALNMVAKTDDVCGKNAARKVLMQYYAERFLADLRTMNLETLAALLELGGEADESWQLAKLLDGVSKKAFREEIPEKCKPKLAKTLLRLLEHEDETVVFEAAFALKEIKEPSSYPGIINKLKDPYSGLSGNARRALKHAAENIAISVTTELMQATRGYRGKGWNERVFLRMARHREILHKLECNAPMQEKKKVR